MLQNELLDDTLSDKIIRTPIIKFLEIILCIFYALLIIFTLYNLVVNAPYQLGEIFEELIIIIIVGFVSFPYLYLWRKSTIACEQKKNIYLLLRKRLKLLIIASFLAGGFLMFIPIMVFYFHFNEFVFSFQGIKEISFLMLFFISGFGQVFYAGLTRRKEALIL